MASALELTRIEENVEESDFNKDQVIDHLPQQIHFSPAQCTSYDDYQDDCVTSKTSKISGSKSKKVTSPVTAEQGEPSSRSSSTPPPNATSTDDEGAVDITPVSSKSVDDSQTAHQQNSRHKRALNAKSFRNLQTVLLTRQHQRKGIISKPRE